MTLRNAVTGEEIPGRVDPTIFYRGVLEGCLKDTVFRSRCGQWMREHPGCDGLDYLWATLKPARDGGEMPRFANTASAVAFALAQPSPPTPWKDQT